MMDVIGAVLLVFAVVVITGLVIVEFRKKVRAQQSENSVDHEPFEDGIVYPLVASCYGLDCPCEDDDEIIGVTLEADGTLRDLKASEYVEKFSSFTDEPKTSVGVAIMNEAIQQTVPLERYPIRAGAVGELRIKRLENAKKARAVVKKKVVGKKPAKPTAKATPKRKQAKRQSVKRTK